MHKKNITILTKTGGEWGTGHFQRMIALADYIKDDMHTHLVIKGSHTLPKHLASLRTKTIPPQTDLIIRDMRDSEKEEIENLQKIAPVLTIDDIGEGRNESLHKIDLLPNLREDSLYNESLFLYGYNFINQINSITNKKFIKDIDFTIYAGNPPMQTTLNTIKKILPINSKAIILTGRKPIEFFTGKKLQYSSAVEIMLRSRFIITHFGITMFEAHLCGIEILALDPTDYHCKLTNLVADKLKITPIGQNIFFKSSTEKILLNRLKSTEKKTFPSIPQIKASASLGLESFKDFILTII